MKRDDPGAFEVRVTGAITGLPTQRAAVRKMEALAAAAHMFEQATGLQVDIRIARAGEPWARREIAA